MLEPNELYTIADGMVKIYEKLNTWAVVDMAERIMEMQEYNWEELSGTTQHLAWCANQSGLHYQDMIKQIEKLTDISGKELHELFKESAVKSIINDNEAYKNHGIEKTGIKTWDDMSDSNKQMAENMYQRTNKTLKNFTKTTARSSQQQLHTALDTAFTEILMGYKSYDKAIADAIKKVGKKGTVVVYNSGYKDTLETCVRRAVMTGINQMAGQTSINNALEMGAEYVKVSKHSDARVNPNNKIADHKGWQGKVYKLDGEDKKYKNLLKETGFDYKGEESDPLGLCGYNCRHVMSPYFPEDEESDEDSEAEEEKMKKEEEEHERLAEERERIREITTLKRMSEAYEAALEKCKNVEVKEELERYANENQQNLDKLSIDEEKKDDIINGIKIPKEIYDISGISKGVVDEIKEGLRKLTNEYNIKLDKLTVRELGADEYNVPFQYCANTRGIYFEYELVVNKGYYFNDTLEEYNDRIMRNYNKGALASKSIEDLLAHEVAHILTFQECDTVGVFTELEWEVKYQAFIKGMSGYADAKRDGAETIAEAFVRYRRGEELPDSVIELLNKYVERWKK